MQKKFVYKIFILNLGIKNKVLQETKKYSRWKQIMVK